MELVTASTLFKKIFEKNSLSLRYTGLDPRFAGTNPSKIFLKYY